MGGFRVFISSTTDDLGQARSEVTKYFESIGADVSAQGSFPDKLNDSEQIRQAIEDADLSICLVGHHNGEAIGFDPPGQDIPKGVSWTQWELLYALEQYRKHGASDARPRLLVCLAGDHFKVAHEDDERGRKQAAFRESVVKQLKDRSGSPFFQNFASVPDLLNQLRSTMEGSHGQINAVLDERWETFKDLYTAHWARRWEDEFPPGQALSAFGEGADEWFADGSALFDLQKAPLIDTQHFAVIEPDADGRQLLHAENVDGGSARDIDFDTLRNAITGGPGSEKLVAPLRSGGQYGGGSRIALVTSAGLGKTTTMQRLLHEINQGGLKFAVFLFAGDLQDEDMSSHTEANVERVVRRALRRTSDAAWWPALGMSDHKDERGEADKEGRKLRSPLALLSHGILKEAALGRLVILIDGLDHVGIALKGIVRLQSEAIWAKTDVVVSGRPYAFEDWKQIERHADVPDERHWRIVVPLEVTDDEAKAYLGGIVGGGVSQWRYVFVSRHFDKQLHVPRLLGHVRHLTVGELVDAKTSADIYYGAIRHLIREGHRQAGNGHSDGDVLRSLRVLGALAFETVFDQRSGKLFKAPADPRNFNAESVDRKLVKRLLPFFGTDGKPAELVQAELRRLHKLATLVGNGLLEDSNATRGTVSWVSLTVQRFLAAYWLSACTSPASDPHTESTDAEWFRSAQHYRYASDAGLTEELNRFLAEMPSSVIEPQSWLSAARAWYDPLTERDQGNSSREPGLRDRRERWPTEMIARSWRTMHMLADLEVDDWWDIPYDNLYRSKLGQRQTNAKALAIPDGANSAVARAARAILAEFFEDFEKLRNTNPLARQFADGEWQQIPAGEFQMGSPKEQQGFPPKTEAFWLKLLDQSIEEDLDKLSARTSPSFWWPGMYGQRARRDEVAWLKTNVFGPYRQAAGKGEEARAKGLKQAMDRLRDNFRRADETAEENPQRIAPFDFCAVPVTNEVYGLFASSHIEDVRGSIEEEQKSHDLDYAEQKKPIAKGDEDHRHDEWDNPKRPAMHITWFDAWVFAQWARWREGDIEYRCRLPHEPEWEFACKRTPINDGESTESPFGQRYWWGNDFYKDSSDPTEESLSTPAAHAFGWPGATRPATNAKPNGYGLKDMIGNVWEWCANIYNERSENELKFETSSTGYSRFRPTKIQRYDAPRVIRGGLWWYLNHISTASSRFRLEPSDGDYKTGFRLVREAMPVAKQ